jgi:hypothetical protein
MAFSPTYAMLCSNTPQILETDMDLETRLTIPPQVMTRLVGDETVLLDLASGIYFGLDGVGKRIWESVADGSSLGQAADVIVAEYEVDEAEARADVLAFAKQLIERGLFVV